MNIILILKGLWIGSTMTIPGVSGGTMAVVTGIYEELIKSINGLRKEPRKYLPFLFKFAFSALVGFVLFAGFVTYLLDNIYTGTYIRFLFAGIVIGGVPLLVRKSGIQKISVSDIFFVCSGALLVYLLTLLPSDMFSSGEGLQYVLMQFVGGFIVAVALILPGISASHMLYILGLYGTVLQKVYNFQWLSLIPLITGIFAGMFITANILEKLLTKCPGKVYMTIIGFVAASIISLLPHDKINSPITCLIVFVAGFFIMYVLGRRYNLNA